MHNLDSINREREDRANLSQYKELIETISKVEYKKFSNLGLIELSEVIALANYTVYYLVSNSKNKELYNTAYLTKAIKWAIRNEMRRRYKWYVMKNQETDEQEQIKDAVYKTIFTANINILSETINIFNPIPNRTTKTIGIDILNMFFQNSIIFIPTFL